MRRSVLPAVTVSALAVLAACGTDSHSIGGARSVSTPTVSRSIATTTTAVASTTTTTIVPIEFRSVDWRDVEIPGGVCDASQPIQMHQGTATIPTPPGVSAGTPQVDVSEWSSVVYGDLLGVGQDVAALNVWCANAGGTADGQIQNSWVIFADMAGTLQTLTTLTPQQPSTAGSHVPFFDSGPGGLEIQTGRITAKEAWYGQSDGTCCPTGKATTVWSFSRGAFTPTTTVQAYPQSA